jgi:pimeloyl-ACP methyl ester carboxylesterase
VKLRRVAPFAAALVALLGAAAPIASGNAPKPWRPTFHPLLHGTPGPPASAGRAADCSGVVQCSTVDVPLDRTGQVPGTISLHVEVVPAQATPRGAIFLIAGGPGQGSAHVFGLDNPNAISAYRFLFPGYTLVAYDDRGTGASGLIDCPAVQVAITPEQNRAAAVGCAQQLGPGRAYYSTAEHAEDMEAVRTALGFDKIALYGVSYGTKLAQAYALAHPDHVERLVLDSVVPADLVDPYGASDLKSMPSKLDGFCSDGGCRAATRNYSGDVAAVANALAAKPLSGKVLLANGKTITKRIDGISLLGTVLDSDLNPGLAAELPAVVHAARNGNTQPLLRLVYLRERDAITPSIDLSFGLYLATVCRDGPFPWAPETPVAQRQPILDAAVAALPSDAFGPFGKWAYKFGNADTCLVWPSPSGGAALGPGPLPDVPMLAISGGYDMRTPTDGAQTVVSRFRQGQLVVVPGVGHSTTTADYSGCAAQKLRAFMLGGTVAGTCARPQALVRPIPALPAAGQARPAKPLGPLQTYSIAARALADAEAIWIGAGGTTAIPGIWGGKLTPGGREFTLSRYAIAKGVAVSGKIKLTTTSLPLLFEGTLTVTGPAASTGLLGLKGTSLRGTLGGRIVGR